MPSNDSKLNRPASNARGDLIPRDVRPVTPRKGESPDGRGASQRSAATPDVVDIASMDSFPCSDPPGYYQIS